MLNEFKNFTAARLQLDDLVALEAFGHSLRDAYDRLQVEEPAFLDTQLKSVKREIRSRIADKVQARKNEIKRTLESLQTPAERKAKLAAELKELEKQEKE